LRHNKVQHYRNLPPPFRGEPNLRKNLLSQKKKKKKKAARRIQAILTFNTPEEFPRE
jgi:hypothetical protein